ncbi:MAG: 4a-hydroxytetrahydrobiopterin dehydratase [Candidatus Paceibacterota bacterium]
MNTLRDLYCDTLENRILESDEINRYLNEVSGWEVKGESIYKKIELDTFAEALEFVNAVAAVAESEGHHPDIHIQYSLVTLTLGSHELGAVSLFDFILAAKIDTLI